MNIIISFQARRVMRGQTKSGGGAAAALKDDTSKSTAGGGRRKASNTASTPTSNASTGNGVKNSVGGGNTIKQEGGFNIKTEVDGIKPDPDSNLNTLNGTDGSPNNNNSLLPDTKVSNECRVNRCIGFTQSNF